MSLGSFAEEEEAAIAFDAAARRLRGDDAHGGRTGKGILVFRRLNFPTQEEVARATARGMRCRQRPCWMRAEESWRATRARSESERE